MKTTTVSIIIPNWNGRLLLEKNLPSVIAAYLNKKNCICEVIVVDDGSTDSSIAFIKSQYKEIRIIKHETNRGFSCAVNTGIKNAKGDLVCLLNTDVIPDSNFLIDAIKHFKDNTVFAVGLHERGHGPATGRFDGYFLHSGKDETKSVEVSLWASGGSAVFRKTIWWKLHGFDEELFSPFYWEDVDLGYRAWKRGYRILWEPKSVVTHAHESVINSSNFKVRYMSLIKERNELLFIWKNIHSKTLIKKHKSEILNRAIHHPGYFMVIWMALRKRKVVLRKREREMRESKLSDEAVFAIFNK